MAETVPKLGSRIPSGGSTDPDEILDIFLEWTADIGFELYPAQEEALLELMADIQLDLDRRRPGRNKHTTQRNEPDRVRILSGVFEGRTTGTPIGLIIHNTDQRSKDYSEIMDRFRPGHADYTYNQKYGVRDYRGGGRSSARETAMRVAAGAIAVSATIAPVAGS